MNETNKRRHDLVERLTNAIADIRFSLDPRAAAREIADELVALDDEVANELLHVLGK